jgi:thiol:disulfide interchange protein
MSARSSRSVLKSIVGWVIVALVAIWLLDIVVGTVRVLARFVLWIVIIGLLVAAYFKLSDDDEE